MKQSIMVVSGIGESTKDALAEHGIKSIADLAKAGIDQLAAVKGFGKARAGNAIAAAKALLESAKSGAEGGAKAKPAEEKVAGKKEKKKKKKKDKSKSKNKSKKKKNKKKNGKSKKK